MAKLFYTLEEAAAKLGKSTDEVMNMAKAGQLQELRNKDQVLFRRSAIDQLAGDSDSGSELNLDAIELAPGEDALQLSGTDLVGDGLSLEETGLNLSTDELRLDDELVLSDDGASAPAAPIAASGAEDSMMLEELTLADDEPAPAKQPAPPMSPAASASGLAARSAIGLADSSAGSVAGGAAGSMAGSAAGSMAGSAAGSRILTGSGAPLGNDDSMMMGAMGQSVEAVGSGSGLLDMSSDESFFAAQMIEESMGGEEVAQLPDGGADIFSNDAGGGDDAAPAAASIGAAVSFGTTQLPEASDPKFSGFTAGAMVAAFVGLVGMGWAITEISVGNYVEIAQVIAENWMYVLGGVAGSVLVFGGIGLGIGKATA
jgi:hypothetical protein